MSNDNALAKGALTVSDLPTLRFRKFRNGESWQEITLKKVLRPVSREVRKPTSEYTGLGLRSHGKGTFQKLNQDPEKTSMDRLYVVHHNDLIVNITFAWEGAIAIASEADHEALVSHRFPTYEFRSGISSPDFFRYIITRSEFVYRLGVISPGGAGRNRVLNKTDFLRLSVALPSMEEQRQIASCMRTIDDLIAAEIEKLEALIAHKNGMVQRLFPSEGKNRPEYRFPEFRDEKDWVWKAIGEISKIYKGKGISKADIDPHGAHPCIRYGELYTLYGEVIAEVESKTNVNESQLFFSKNNDVIIPSSGETKVDIATASCILKANIALGGDLNVIRSPENGVFLSYFLNGPLRYEVARVAQGDSVVHLYPKQIQKLRVALPSRKEQSKIASFLMAADSEITAQRERIDALTAHKEGLAQKLFPALNEV